MGKYVIKPQERPTYSPAGHQGTINIDLITRDTGAKCLESVLGVVSAEGKTEAHSHDVEQAQYMIEGRAYVEVDGEVEEAKAGDILFFPQGKVHRITAVGGPFKCLVIYAPPRGSQVKK